MRPTYTIKALGLGLIWTLKGDGSATLETTDFDVLRRALGDQILAGFLRLFVWVDRIQSLIMFGYWNLQSLPVVSVASARNLQTMVWFTGGTLYEAARAVFQLRRAGIEGRLYQRSEWDELQGIARRWASRRELITVRNSIAFHVDEDTIADGMVRASNEGERLQVIAGDSHKAVGTSYRLGLEILLGGTGLTLQQYEGTIQTLADDYSRFSELVGRVFYRAASAAGAKLPPLDNLD